MAIKCINKVWSKEMGASICEYVCDTDADFASLPVAATGSTALSAASGAIKIVNASGAWVNFGE